MAKRNDSQYRRQKRFPFLLSFQHVKESFKKYQTFFPRLVESTIEKIISLSRARVSRIPRRREMREKNLEVVLGDSSWHGLLDLSSLSSWREKKKEKKRKKKKKKKSRGEETNG